MNGQVLQHPGLQQGLGSPVEAVEPQAPTNPYVRPNVALQVSNGRVTGANDLALAQAQEAGAQAGKAQAEVAMLQQLQGLAPAQPEYSPEEVQAQQISEAIVNGQLGREQLTELIQAGEVSPGVADAATTIAERTIIQRSQEQGLGGRF